MSPEITALVRTNSQPPVVTAAISRGLHDLAQPLTMLLGMLELALIRPQTESELRNSMAGSIEQANRAIGLLNQIRELVNEQRTVKSVDAFPDDATKSASGKAQACQPR